MTFYKWWDENKYDAFSRLFHINNTSYRPVQNLFSNMIWSRHHKALFKAFELSSLEAKLTGMTLNDTPILG